jgi:O-antigen/teichoic acid export membrane protein
MKLKDKALYGIFWSGTEKFFQQILKFVFFVLLARILEPYCFGLIGMLSIFLAIPQTLIDSGLGNALIQKIDREGKDFSTVFTFNLSMSVLFYIILFFTAPLIASFYNQIQLVLILRVLSLVLIVNSFFLVQVIRLRIYLDFKKQMKINVFSMFVAGIIAVFLALRGLGVWALVYYQLIQSLAKAIFYSIEWFPCFGFHTSSFKRLFSYGSKLLAASLINNFFYNIYNLVIGKVFNATELGYYERAKKLQNMITDNVNSTIQVVSFPFMSNYQNKSEKLTFGYKKIFELLAFANFPLMVFLFLSARPLVLLLLSSKWEASIPFLQLLTFVGLLYPIHSLNMNILAVKGRTDILLKLEIIKKIIVVIIIILSLKYGIKGLIIGQIIASLTAFIINSEFAGRLVNLNFKKQLIIFFPSALLSFISFLITDIATKLFVLPNILLILVKFFIFFTIYIVSAKIFKIEAYSEVKTSMIKLIGMLNNEER